MNKMDYDVVTIGNHEFDYGMDALEEVLDGLDVEVVSCNLSYVGKKEDKLRKVKPYTVKQFDNLKIGIVGVTTPDSLTDAAPSIFKEEGETVYAFSNQSEEAYYHCIQTAIGSDKMYTVAANNFILIEGGNGANMFVDDEELEAPVRIDYQVIIDYVTED